MGTPRAVRSGLKAGLQPFTAFSGHPTGGLPVAAATLHHCSPSPSWWAPASSLLPLSPKSLALLGWYPWAGGRHPVPGGTQKLIAASLCSSSDNEKSSRAAASLLGNMWQYTKLHRDFKVVRTSLLRDPGAGPRGGAQGSQGQGLHPGKPSHPDASRQTALLASLPLPPEEVGTSPKHRPLGGRRLEERGQWCDRACDGWPVLLQKGYRKEDFLSL